jgi:glycerophosphoryl diester phosphodiesterase/predicted amidohydrolase
MKVVSIQPAYPYREENMEQLVGWLMNALDQCDPEMDLIVLPEACNAMSEFETLDAFYASAVKYGSTLIEKAKETAKRCQALVAINLYVGENNQYRNTTQIYGKEGTLLGEYYKQHLPSSEAVEKKITADYTRKFHSPYILDVDGIRYAFLTCYDCYFNEYIQHIASKKPDILIVSSLQRSETMNMLSVQMKNAAFTCNAYLVRSSVSMGDEQHLFGATSMIVSPKGETITELGQKVGMIICDIDPHKKHMRPNTYNHPDVLNDSFIESGRTPWAYRSCGPSVCLGELESPYPRICAHRGFNTILPENTMASFGLAVALGAVEIELDVWPSKDGMLVVCHDDTVDRTSDGNGAISELEWAEICQFDIGKKYVEMNSDKMIQGKEELAKHYSGLKFPLLEDVLKKFSRQVIINLHIKSPIGAETDMYDPVVFQKIVDAIYEYDMQEHVYIAGEEDVLRTACQIAPELPRAALDGKLDFSLIKLAKKYDCKKVQLFRGYYNQEMIDEAKEAGIRCNIFWSDDPNEIPELLEKGIDTILTNDYLKMANRLLISMNK